MNYVRVGNSGLKITELTFGSALTIGTESGSESYAQKMIDTAWEAGIRSFDTANNYGMGQAEYLLGIRTLPIKDKTENNILLCSYSKFFPL